MREMDRITPQAANARSPRVHRGRLGHVLERYLDSLQLPGREDYSVLALERLWRDAARHDPAIGLNLYARFTAQDVHVLAHASLYCANIEQALRNWARYAPLASDMDRLTLLEDPHGAGIELHIDAPASLTRYVVEHYFVMALTQFRRATGITVQPSRSCFAHAQPAYSAQYRPWFGEQVAYGGGHNRMYFDAGTLSLPLLTRHSGMLEVINQELDRRLARLHTLSGWGGKVAAGIWQSFAQGRLPTLEDQAAALHQSPRTLRRRLEEEGQTFRQLLDQVRGQQEQALELQGESSAAIAEQLGYSDVAAYLHARKRWRGMA
ncbi:MAG: AraC family transcriptional regulator ligand-binding domain-containing protein [Pseudomonas sp.]|uniref:AraC family transcriptional regulator ligand-binding domain-containing protein n=1 Tax=Pseudomonas abieticivorans TaxID=2931382 RepID=UPI0020BEB387|nr:AraC family transcriptional regulator ligand-binding domain-containing protein [Pseudomonas sp. PIA16]MDE1164169.1 AraC family transcriptional regulator ligand-binding domain-containing protein [Pseudomonas sp.]